MDLNFALLRDTLVFIAYTAQCTEDPNGLAKNLQRSYAALIDEKLKKTDQDKQSWENLERIMKNEQTIEESVIL